MADDPERSLPPDDDEEDDDDLASTPFDSPWFIPVLLWGGAVWFGYDGWFNPEMEWIKFNRYGFGVILVAAIWFTWKAYRETRDGERSSPE